MLYNSKTRWSSLITSFFSVAIAIVMVAAGGIFVVSFLEELNSPVVNMILYNIFH